jgi:hypothetical protein
VKIYKKKAKRKVACTDSRKFYETAKDTETKMQHTFGSKAILDRPTHRLLQHTP